MSEVLKLVKTYRVSSGTADRLHLAESLLAHIEPKLGLFIASGVPPAVADDVLQEVLTAIVLGLESFKGDSNEQFWAWCYRIARNKMADQLRKQGRERLHFAPPEDLYRLVDAAQQADPVVAEEGEELRQAMQLLALSKPECHNYLWQHFILGVDFAEIAEQEGISYDTVRMRINRCLTAARALMA